jgi:hypothetical protein
VGHVKPRAGAPAPATTPGRLADRDIAGLLFVAEMYAVQADQLGLMLGVPAGRAQAVAAGWRRAGYALSSRIGPGPPWVWLTRGGLAACGLPYTAASPALSRLAHLRAVTAVRLALEATPGYRRAGAHWRGERRLRARAGGRVGLREHIPDGEVHWPDGAPVAWAGECWAIEAELTRKTVTRTATIMQEILTRTGDYACPAGQARVPGAAPRHARVVYLCAPAALPVVRRARDSLGGYRGRIEIRALPPGAAMHPAEPAAPSPGDSGPATGPATRAAGPGSAPRAGAGAERSRPEAAGPGVAGPGGTGSGGPAATAGEPGLPARRVNAAAAGQARPEAAATPDADTP